MLDKLLQPEKAPLSIEVTLLGKVMTVRALQPENEPSPTAVIPEAITIFLMVLR